MIELHRYSRASRRGPERLGMRFGGQPPVWCWMCSAGLFLGGGPPPTYLSLTCTVSSPGAWSLDNRFMWVAVAEVPAGVLPWRRVALTLLNSVILFWNA